MNRLTRRLLGLVPLAAGLGLAATWVLTGAAGRQREQAETSIRLRWEAPAEAPGVVKDLVPYLDRFGGDPAAVWFAVEAYAHLRDPKRAYEAVSSRPAIRDERGAPRHLARLLVESMSRIRGAAEGRSEWAGRLLHIRLEASEPNAIAEWGAFSTRLTTPDAMMLFVPASRTPSIGTRAIATALSARKDDRELRAAGAILLASPSHTEDVPFLIELFRSSWREERRPTWQHIARALGTTGDPRAIEALTTYVDSPAGDQQVGNQTAVDMGLAVAGDAEARKRLFAAPAAPGLPRLLSLYGMGLGLRLSDGDERAIPRFVELWDGMPDPMFRFQLAEVVLMADPVPPTTFPTGRWADALLASDVVLYRALAHAWLFRTGAETAFQSLGADLLEASALAEREHSSSPEDPGPGALMEVLRAWLRFGG